jgi:hypothetical protein
MHGSKTSFSQNLITNRNLNCSVKNNLLKKYFENKANFADDPNHIVSLVANKDYVRLGPALENAQTAESSLVLKAIIDFYVDFEQDLVSYEFICLSLKGLDFNFFE